MNWKIGLTIGLLSFVIGGCASPKGPAFEMPPVATDKVTVYAFRPASIVGGGNSDLVAVNGQFIGRVNSGTYAVYETDPGTLLISRKVGSIFFSEGEDAGWGLGAVVGALDGYVEVFATDAAAGEVYFVRFSSGELVPMAEALPLMDGLVDVTPPR